MGKLPICYQQEFKANHQSVEWQDMVAMRHILVHGYYQIKDEIVWATIESELLPLKEKIQEILNNSAADANY